MERKYVGTGLTSEKKTKKTNSHGAEAATSSYSATADFCNIFMLCLLLRIIRRSDVGVSFLDFPS